ncbi:MAG: ABC transporter ATP-binding protein [Chloroflexi bacterium]|nr:ABC transporter ATP-binding protein [Chloroflexota bacterium]
MKPVIEVEGLSKEYQMGEEVVYALREVSFQVQSGAFMALMGPSGSGKSTLMHLLGCLDTPTNGRYLLNDCDISHLSRRARAEVRNQNIGFVFQSFNLLPRLSTLENVALPLLYRKRSHNGEKRSEKVLATLALQQVGLADRLGHKPTELSGGQRQRVAIARALVTNPALILADEPTGNLDSRTGADILNLLEDLNGNGRTIILVTHDAHVADQARRVLHMQDGRIVNLREGA